MAVADAVPDKLLGVREGFLRYFHDGLERPVPVAVAARPDTELVDAPLPLTDREILALARQRALRLQETHGEVYDFCIGTENGLLSFGIDGLERTFVRSWTVLIGLGEEVWGSSGSIQLPERLIAGLGSEQVPFAIPGTRRSGGMAASLTGGLEDRRTATALSTLHALSTLMYGRLESRPLRRR